jgi:hypothetical protein
MTERNWKRTTIAAFAAGAAVGWTASQVMIVRLLRRLVDDVRRFLDKKQP